MIQSTAFYFCPVQRGSRTLVSISVARGRGDRLLIRIVTIIAVVLAVLVPAFADDGREGFSDATHRWCPTSVPAAPEMIEGQECSTAFPEAMTHVKVPKSAKRVIAARVLCPSSPNGSESQPCLRACERTWNGRTAYWAELRLHRWLTHRIVRRSSS